MSKIPAGAYTPSNDPTDPRLFLNLIAEQHRSDVVDDFVAAVFKGAYWPRDVVETLEWATAERLETREGRADRSLRDRLTGLLSALSFHRGKALVFAGWVIRWLDEDAKRRGVPKVPVAHSIAGRRLLKEPERSWQEHVQRSRF